MLEFFRSAQSYVLSLWYRWKYRDRIRCVSVDEKPGALRPGLLYLIGEDTPWSAALLCPCGCEMPVELSLIEADHPSWELTISKVGGLPTLRPSVWRTEGCKAHFFLRDGRVVWHYDDPIRNS